MAGTAELVSNPSFMGRDGVQIDVTYYAKKRWGNAINEVVEISRDESVSYLHIDPDDVPLLIAALQQVYDRRQAEVAETEAK